MSTVSPPPSPPTPAAAAALALLEDLCRGIDPADFAVRLWDGTRWSPDPTTPPRFTLVVRTPAALRRLLRPGSEAALATAHLEGELDVEGDVLAVPNFAAALLGRRRSLGEKARLALRLLRVPRADGAAQGTGALPAPALEGRRHTTARDRAAVRHHYDISNRFYELFLDPAMAYTCAVFAHPEEALETAQHRKLDLVCRKLRLRPGDRLLDVGCGWGSLILHAAREYGATALGITLSPRQAELAGERIRAAGLEARCRVEVADYREVEGSGTFDKVASVGMFEHVGHSAAPTYLAAILRLLRPGGVYLHHAITAHEQHPQRGVPTLSELVFPDHEVLPLSTAIAVAEEAGFDTRDVENLREHYALTLRQWVRNLERNREAAVAEVGEPTWRAWRLVFAGAAANFAAGRRGLHQVLFAKPAPGGAVEVPLLRTDWYGA